MLLGAIQRGQRISMLERGELEETYASGAPVQIQSEMIGFVHSSHDTYAFDARFRTRPSDVVSAIRYAT